MNKLSQTFLLAAAVSLLASACGAAGAKCAGVTCSAGEECKPDTGKCGPIGSGGSGGTGGGSGGTGGGMGGSGGGGGNQSAALETFASELSKALCSYLEGCGALDASQKAICEAAFSSGNPLVTLPTGFSKNPAAVVRKAMAGGLGYDAAQAAKCLAAFPTYGCAGFTYSSSTVLPAECLGVFKTGVVGPGGKCSASGDCDAGTCTTVNGCGTCSVAANKMQGESCTSTTQCIAGLRCITNGADAGSTCDAPRSPPGFCASNADCNVGNGYCPSLSPTDGGFRRCVNYAATSEVCDWEIQTGSNSTTLGICGWGLFCDNIDGGNGPCMPVRMSGDSCGGSWECNRDAGHSCRTLDAGAGVPLARKCLGLYPDSTPCLSSSDCQSGSCPTVNDGGVRVCTPKGADGTPCTLGSQCASAYCNNLDFLPTPAPRTCGYLASGAECASNSDCGAGNFCKGYLPSTTDAGKVSGTCAALSPQGGPCTDENRTGDSCSATSETCIGGTCKVVNPFSLPVNSECDAVTQCGGKSYCKITEPRIRKGSCAPFLNAGESCTTSTECGGTCTGTPKACAARLSAGEVCTTLATPPCKVGLRCAFDAGTYACAPLSGLGEACPTSGSTTNCHSGICAFDAGMGACTEYAAGGQVVSTSSLCASAASVLDAGVRTCVDVCF